MNIKNVILGGTAALLVTACIPSVNPYYTPKDVVFEPKLVGEWLARDGDEEPERWAFVAADENRYSLTVTEKDGSQGQFRATLFKLGSHRFLDLIPEKVDYAEDQADMVAASMFPGHLLLHVAQIEPELKMAFTNFDWLEDYLKEHPRALAHHAEEDALVLTATTKELQRFVRKHVDGGELFEEYGELSRVEAAPTESPEH